MSITKMPFKSKSQMRLMYAVKNNESNKVPKKVADDYIEASKGMNFKRLKEKISKYGKK